jgi:hypothetical protein
VLSWACAGAAIGNRKAVPASSALRENRNIM